MLNCRIATDISTIKPEQWQQLEFQNNPFLSHIFLSGLEQYCYLRQQYWQPHHIVLEKKQCLLGLMPLYLKQDSYGEFVPDWMFADAYHRMGKSYYPKLVSAIPFTPVSGRRILVRKKQDKVTISDILIKAAVACMQEGDHLSSLHVLFPNDDDVDLLKQKSGLSRITCQYHWLNYGYRDFKDFTDTLTAKKRKKILAERRKVKEEKIDIERLNGHEISNEQWHIFYQFYCATFQKKWGEPRLTLDFFQFIGEKLPKQTLLILAKKNDEYIAGVFAMRDEKTLYGRHWGCKQFIPFLHFELCYYQTIEYVIQAGLEKLDAGVQGEHKLARGFYPVAVPSLHWFKDADFSLAIQSYAKRETVLMKEHIQDLEQHLPYKLNSPYG